METIAAVVMPVKTLAVVTVAGSKSDLGFRVGFNCALLEPSGVMDWMTGHFEEPLSIRELAARALMSERTFTQRFRRATDRPPIDWLINLRVARATALLEESCLPIETIAAQSGLADADALRHHLRSITGISPGVYRRKMGGEIRQQ
jgi:AraC family transcriptional regulator, transcriptional activator FtrA